MARSALVVIDMLNTYAHEDAERLVPSVAAALPAIVDLLRRARAAGTPVVYANDNFGDWRSHHGEILDLALGGRHPELVEPVRPDEEALFVVKARHSVFYETPLEYLLRSLDVTDLVLTGQVTEQCVLYSALDAHIRHLDVTVPRDAVAHIHEDLARAALRMIERNMGGRIVDAADVAF
ncbi:cysteine hydrolase [Streptomyces roseofulvus]|uniref:Isochorismatase family cysteine hydrolase n=2 Tax=Streptomyces TaxID=1883 RepID=A0ABU4K8G4_9ACTN|nr:isochorismatase family cysteine hydrolase [Streptomyces roseolus]MDX2294051.1 isochorismatase family cysteine hydrolase [Streptomyces roseolus]